MSARSTIAALSGAVLISLGAPVAVAAPQIIPPSQAEPGDYPLNGPGTAPRTGPGVDDQADKAERFGGGLATELIDLATGIIKCGLNLATDTVPCPL
ncbi:hypothetical protein [Nocardia lasii]|uniref:DUF732 domain-containing protein n=1 Tax=Nocardia lasii TaxID=1616107 RepID=A0ABW1JQP2_9NOCA